MFCGQGEATTTYTGQSQCWWKLLALTFLSLSLKNCRVRNCQDGREQPPYFGLNVVVFQRLKNLFVLICSVPFGGQALLSR